MSYMSKQSASSFAAVTQRKRVIGSTLRSVLRFALMCGVISVCVAADSSSSASSRYNRLGMLKQTLDGEDSRQDLVIVPLGNSGEELIVSRHTKHAHPPTYPAPQKHYGAAVDASEGKYLVPAKREPAHRCGMVLIRYIQKLCNGCVGRPRSGEEPAGRKKRSTEAFLETVSLTEKCCENVCDDSDMRMFCCENN